MATTTPSSSAGLDKKSAHDALRELSFEFGMKVLKSNTDEKDEAKRDRKGEDDRPASELLRTNKLGSSETHDADTSPRLPVWVEDIIVGDEQDYEETASSLPRRLSSFRRASINNNKKNSSLCLLDVLSDDVSTLILSHLTLSEIAQVSCVSRHLYLASRSNSLWKRLFENRWNIRDASCQEDNGNDDAIESYYFTAYRSAHLNPHDLWITHWNCVFPTDGLTPGRCYIPNPSSHSPSSSRKRRRRTRLRSTDKTTPSNTNLPPTQFCPNCRDWKSWENTVNAAAAPSPRTRAQVMARATLHTRRRFGNLRLDHEDDDNDNDDDNNHESSSHVRSKRAFQAAATFHRKLQTQQFQSCCRTNFLSDVLFFNITSPIHSDGQWELDQLLLLHERGGRQQEHQRNNNNPRIPLLGAETTNHSWHVIQLTNPDFYRPIIFQFGIQRPECFTVYPSEGFLMPGCSTTVTCGVRPLGCALAYAFEGLNVRRDGLEAGWADLYTDQAHLPLAPYLVRYRYAASPPGFWSDSMHPPWRRPPPTPSVVVQQQHHENDDPNNNNNNNNNNHVNSNNKSEKQLALEYHWKQPVPPHSIKSIHLSAHVHAHYHFSKFLQDTCQPYVDVGVKGRGGIYSAPMVQELYPKVWERLLQQQQQQHFGKIMRSHMEGPCRGCRKSWGLREEEMAQAYWVMRGECAWHQERRKVLMRNIEACLQLFQTSSSSSSGGGGSAAAAVDDILPGSSARRSALLYKITCILQAMKAAPWISRQQKQILVKMEALADDLYHNIRVGGEECIPWRMEGVYRHALCTDSVFGSPMNLDDSIQAIWKDEPDFLDAFRHLAHSPGRFCLGPQEDPNHLGETVVPSSKRYFRVQRGPTTDLFMDDPFLALQAGICMMVEPRSLLAHGLYDRIPYAGTVVRRPREFPPPLILPIEKEVPVRSSSNENDSSIPRLIVSNERLTYYRLQDSLDLNSIVEVDKLFGGSFIAIAGAATSTSSMHNFLNNIPPPGVGRFALSYLTSQDDNSATRTRVIASLEFDTDSDTMAVHAGEDPMQRPQADDGAAARPPGVAAPRNLRGGARFLQLLWVLGAQLGLAVNDTPEYTVFVDRRILIASNWFCISLMAVPHFLTLCARCLQWIPSRPTDYELDGLPFEATNEMRYLTEHECGASALCLVLVWLGLGRWTERHACRGYFRIMLEHMTPIRMRDRNIRFLPLLRSKLSLWIQRQYDSFCPLFLQRRVFTPHWNQRSRDDLLQHISFWRSINLPEQRAAADASVGRVFGDVGREQGIEIGGDSSARNLVVGTFVALGSFCSSSPHFWLNYFSIFSCSISLGMSVSLNSMEKGASGVTVSSTTGSLITTLSLATVVILAFLVGQLVGSSGGTMFLAEFIVTSVSLLLGGAGTISANAMESWFCFFCLSTTAFWGYLFGRVALLDGIRQKRGGYASILLTTSIAGLCFFWVLVFVVSRWESPVDLVIDQAAISEEGRNWNRKMRAKKLQ